MFYLQNSFNNIGDTIESFVMDLAYDGVYRSWPCLKNKLAIDKGSFPLIVLTFSHFIMVEVNRVFYFSIYFII